MSEFLLISMNEATTHNFLSTNSKFTIPDLKVGTLDVLVSLSGELAKLDTFLESIVKKVAQYMADILEDNRDKVQENLLHFDLTTYITRFQWDKAKYPVQQSMKNISVTISKMRVIQIDNELKGKASVYNSIKGNLGSLLTRILADIVKKEDFVLDSEYLITLLVVVFFPLVLFIVIYSDWQKTYEMLSEMVVPRSSILLSEDQHSGLFSVTLFRKAKDDFKLKAKEKKVFIVRDFQYNEEKLKADKEEITQLSTDKKKQLGPLGRWLKVTFSEAFIVWIHTKALRVFTESILRYGLPVSFQPMLYKHLDSSDPVTDASIDIPGLNLNQQEYPYVYYKIDCNFFDFK
uniref:V-type proton ATPase subunit C n=1 Tax=Electrophorus electricus TaxID=8005 RepID=A0A4W4G0Y6_ELEEL